MDKLKLLKQKDKYILLALDHRGSLFRALKEKGIQEDLEKEAFDFKKNLIEVLCPQFSGVLLDPEIGLRAYNYVGCKKPFLLCLEKSGYEQKEGERFTYLEYSPEQVKKLGAVACKLLLYFNPNYPSSRHQLDVAKEVFKKTNEVGLPLFLEIVIYDKFNKKVKEDLIIDSLKIFLEKGVRPQVFKLQPPSSKGLASKITELLNSYNTDWIVLTQGIDFEEFEERLRQAVFAGCKGFLAGRSIWKEGVGKKDNELIDFLKKVAYNRFLKISKIVF